VLWQVWISWKKAGEMLNEKAQIIKILNNEEIISLVEKTD